MPGERFQARHVLSWEKGLPRKRLLGSEVDPSSQTSRTSVFSSSTSGPPIWPGSTFFKRNGALLQGRCLGAAAHPVPSSPSLLLCAWCLSGRSLLVSSVWLLYPGSECPLLSSSCSSVLVAGNCEFETRPLSQGSFFGGVGTVTVGCDSSAQ